MHEIDYGTPKSKAAKTVTLKIDGREVTVPEGTSIMRAAMHAGIEIPKLCATDMLKAFGSCRLCLVEIEGRGGTPASCTTPVAEGMVVHTKTERLERMRKGVMELYVSDHSVDSLDRAANGNKFVELLDMAGDGRPPGRALWFRRRAPPQCRIDESNPYFILRSGQMHRLLALRAGLRRGAGHLCPDDRGRGFARRCRPA